jgi:Tol biopolymer transport system component
MKKYKKLILIINSGLISILFVGFFITIVGANPFESSRNYLINNEKLVEKILDTGTTIRVSVSSNGEEGNEASYSPSISANGRYIVFSSNANNLVEGDNNECGYLDGHCEDVFLHDVVTTQTVLISKGTNGVQGNGGSTQPSISADGRFIAFESFATNFTYKDTYDYVQIYVHDRQHGQTTLISINSYGTPGQRSSFEPSMSADGRLITFHSYAFNLAGIDTNKVCHGAGIGDYNCPDIFLHDQETGIVTLISKNTEGKSGNGTSIYPSISANGRYIAFESTANDLVENDTNNSCSDPLLGGNCADIFVNDIEQNITSLVSVNSNGVQGDLSSHKPAISADGRYIVFYSSATTLIENDTNGIPDVFLHDRLTGITKRVSIDSNGSETNGLSEDPAISADGRFIVFKSSADNLVPGDLNNYCYGENCPDIFIHDQFTGETKRVSVASDGTEGNYTSDEPTISADGKFIAFRSLASNLVPGDTNICYGLSCSDIFVHNFTDGYITDTYTISGRVIDESGDPILDVVVWASFPYNGRTNDNGFYYIDNVPAGEYSVRPEMEGYDFSPELITVSVPQNAEDVDFTGTLSTIVDLSVDRIELNQVFLTESDPITEDQIPLIAMKPTIARIFTKVVGVESVSDVTARLIVQYRDGSYDEFENYNEPIIAKVEPDPTNFSDSIFFELPTYYLQDTITLTVEIDPENQIDEIDEGNNFFYDTADFEYGKKLRIYWSLAPYQGHYPTVFTALIGTQLMEKMFPLGINDLEYIFQPGSLSLPMEKFKGVNYVESVRKYWRLLNPDGWVSGTPPDRLFVWIPDEAREEYGVCGVSDPKWENQSNSGLVAIGSDNCTKSINYTLTTERVFAHEIGHVQDDYGLKHTKNEYLSGLCFNNIVTGEDQYPPYIGPKGTIGAYGFDIESLNILDPANTFDFMSYCKPGWISPYNYIRLSSGYPTYTMDHNPTLNKDTSATTNRQVLVSGIVYTPSLTTEFDPFYMITSTLPISGSLEGDYCFAPMNNDIFLDFECFDLSFYDIESDEYITEDFFVETVAFPDETTHFKLTYKGDIIGEIPVSSHVPEVTILTPNGGEVWPGDGKQTMVWNASDLDGDDLYYLIEYSNDSGETWVPIGWDIVTPSYEIDLSHLPGGTSVKLRVGASDGVNTSYDESDNSFTVVNKPPLVFIENPKHHNAYSPNVPLIFEGIGFDFEDGQISDFNLMWESNVDGLFGFGSRFDSSLTPGWHEITLTGMDKHGGIGSDSVLIFVGNRVYLPNIFR